MTMNVSDETFAAGKAAQDGGSKSAVYQEARTILVRILESALDNSPDEGWLEVIVSALKSGTLDADTLEQKFDRAIIQAMDDAEEKAAARDKDK